MTYKCVDCGHIFEDGEQANWKESHGFADGSGELFSGCPLCYGAYEETTPCKGCFAEHTDEELYEGWCLDCLREELTYETFLEYCEANRKENLIETFVLSEFFGVAECPEGANEDFHQLMVSVYKEKVEEANMLPNLYDFWLACERFVLHDDGSNGRENFADWLNERG